MSKEKSLLFVLGVWLTWLYQYRIDGVQDFSFCFWFKRCILLRSTKMKSNCIQFFMVKYFEISFPFSHLTHMMTGFKSSLVIGQWNICSICSLKILLRGNNNMTRIHIYYVNIVFVKMFLKKCVHHNLSVIFPSFSVKSLQRWTSITLEVVSGRCQLF